MDANLQMHLFFMDLICENLAIFGLDKFVSLVLDFCAWFQRQ